MTTSNYQFARVHFNNPQDVMLGIAKRPESHTSEVNVSVEELKFVFNAEQLEALAWLAVLPYDQRHSEACSDLSSCPKYSDWKLIQIRTTYNFSVDATKRDCDIKYVQTFVGPKGLTYQIAADWDTNAPLTLKDVKEFLTTVYKITRVLPQTFWEQRQEIVAWEAEMDAAFSAALEALKAGNSLPMEEFYGHPLRALNSVWGQLSIENKGPYQASWRASREDTTLVREYAEAVLATRDAEMEAARLAAKVARRAFQIRALDFLRASPEDMMRAERGMYPPDELAQRLVITLIPSAEILNCDGCGERDMAISAERFSRLLELEEAYAESGAVDARAVGVQVEFKVVEAYWERSYEDDPKEPCLLVTVSDSTGASNWTRTVRVSLFPHSSTQS